MKIPNVTEAIEKNMAAKIKRYPCHTTRASSIGYFVPMLDGCLRRGVYERTHWQEKELYDVGSAYVFNEGNVQEREVIKSIMEAGFDLIEQQTPFTYEKDGKVLATGSIDGKIIVEDDGAGHPTVAIPAEIKSMHPNIFDTMFTIEDFDKKPWTKAYKAQMTMYMLMQGIDHGIFFIKNKSTGRIRQINVTLDYELGEACLKTAEDIDKHVVENTLPDRIDNRDLCSRCPFRMLCLPDISWGTTLKIADDPGFEKKIDECMPKKQAAAEYKKEWDIIRERAKSSAGDDGNLNLVLGKYLLTGKTNAKGSFSLKIDTV